MQAARYFFLSDEESVLQTLYQKQETRVGTQVWSIRSYLGSNLSGQFSINCTNLQRRQCHLIVLSSFQKVIHFAYLLFSCIPICSFRGCLQCYYQIYHGKMQLWRGVRWAYSEQAFDALGILSKDFNSSCTIRCKKMARFTLE